MSSCACIPNILASFLGVCVCICVNMPDDEEQIENEMACTFFSPPLYVWMSVCFLCVCLVNLFRLFSLLQTHANEIEWKRMTSIQAQTDSLISPSLLSSFSNTALLTASFFQSPVFFTSCVSPPPSSSLSHTWLHSDTQPYMHASLKACKQAENLTTMHRPHEGRSHKKLRSPWWICFHTISPANHFH